MSAGMPVKKMSRRLPGFLMHVNFLDIVCEDLPLACKRLVQENATSSAS